MCLWLSFLNILQKALRKRHRLGSIAPAPSPWPRWLPAAAERSQTQHRRGAETRSLANAPRAKFPRFHAVCSGGVWRFNAGFFCLPLFFGGLFGLIRKQLITCGLRRPWPIMQNINDSHAHVENNKSIYCEISDFCIDKTPRNMKLFGPFPHHLNLRLGSTHSQHGPSAFRRPHAQGPALGEHPVDAQPPDLQGPRVEGLEETCSYTNCGPNPFNGVDQQK